MRMADTRPGIDIRATCEQKRDRLGLMLVYGGMQWHTRQCRPNHSFFFQRVPMAIDIISEAIDVARCRKNMGILFRDTSDQRV